MPLQRRDLHLLMEWKPMAHYFHPDSDRLELMTVDNQKLMLQWSSTDPHEGYLILDPEHLPAPFTELPSRLVAYKEAIGCGAQASEPWHVALYDSALTDDGSTITFRAFGAGWSWEVPTYLRIKSISAMQRSYINIDTLARSLDGVNLIPTLLRGEEPEPVP